MFASIEMLECAALIKASSVLEIFLKVYNRHVIINLYFIDYKISLIITKMHVRQISL